MNKIYYKFKIILLTFELIYIFFDPKKKSIMNKNNIYCSTKIMFINKLMLIF